MQSNYIKVYMPIYRYFGGHPKAILLCFLINRHDYFEARNELQDGFFFQSTSYLANEMGISERYILKMKDSLVQAGLITSTRGIAKGTFNYKIHTTEINHLIQHGNLSDLRGPENEGFTMKRTQWSSKRDENGKLLSIKETTILSDLGGPGPENGVCRTSQVQADIIFYNIKKQIKFIFFREKICDFSIAENIVEIINHFNSLEGTTNHQIKQGSKLIERITKYLVHLLHGYPIEHKKDGIPPAPLQRFFNSHKIPNELQSKKWTKEEIMEILPKAVELAKASNQTKVNLPDLFYNFKHGYSNFLKAATTQPSGDLRTQTLAKRMVMDLEDKRTPVPIAEELITPVVNQFGLSEVRSLFQWGIQHQGQQYIPTMYKVEDFVNKYEKFQAARSRSNGKYVTNAQIQAKNAEPGFKNDLELDNRDPEAMEKALQEWKERRQARKKARQGKTTPQ